MSKPLPLHTYRDILDVETAPSLPYPIAGYRSHMKVHQGMYANGLGNRAVNRLPFEVLTEIFKLYFDSSPVVYKLGHGPLEPGIYNNIAQQLNPFVLAHVCAYWRAVISSIPSFWDSICIVGPLYNQSYAIKSWLSCAHRASVQLIQLDIRCALHELGEATGEVLSALIQYSPRWKDLHLEFRYTEFHKVLFELNPHRLQCLEDVYIELPPWANRRKALHRFWSVIYQAPYLSRVAWNTQYAPPPLTLSAWNQLTVVECEGCISYSDLWTLLETSPNLHRLQARGITIRDPLDPSALTPIIHKNLRILDVEFRSSPVPFYSRLVLPKLKNLRVVRNIPTSDEHPATVAVALSKLLRLSSSSSTSSRLESLTILDPLLPDTLLIGCFHLRELQNLRYLGLGQVSNEIMTALRRAPPPFPSILPHLLRLDVYTKCLGVDTTMQICDQVELIRPSLRKLLKTRPAPFKISLHYLGRVIDSRNVC